jgi:hypothetical protein
VYLGGKFLEIISLRGVGVCKILITGWLLAKYWKIRGCGPFFASKGKAPVIAGAFFYLV